MVWWASPLFQSVAESRLVSQPIGAQAQHNKQCSLGSFCFPFLPSSVLTQKRGESEAAHHKPFCFSCATSTIAACGALCCGNFFDRNLDACALGRPSDENERADTERRLFCLARCAWCVRLCGGGGGRVCVCVWEREVHHDNSHLLSVGACLYKPASAGPRATSGPEMFLCSRQSLLRRASVPAQAPFRCDGFFQKGHATFSGKYPGG